MSWIELVAQRRPPTAPPGLQPPENAKDWFRIENNADDVEATDVYVYDSIGGWFGMYADEFIEALGEVTTSKINLRLNSPGGSVFEGIAIANAIRSHPATVTVYVDSLAASIASVIALAGDRVVMMPQSQFMVHNASGAAYGDSTEMVKMAEMLDKQSRNIAEAYATHTGKPLAEWQAYMAEETWFTAEEAVAVGLADEVAPMRPKKEESAPAASALSAVMNRTWDLSMFRYEGREAAPEPKAFAPGGIVNKVEIDGEDVTEHVALPKGEVIVNLSLSGTELAALIKDAVRNVFPPPDEDEEEPEDAATPPDEDEESEPEDAAPAPDEESEDPEDADKKLPPFLQPDEDEEEDDDTDNATPAEPVDEWSSLVDRLTTPSPSADDVFSSLKEAW